MRRAAFDDLKTWADGDQRRPLVVRGARQVGKTWLLEAFAREHLGDVATVNVERHAGIRSLLAEPSPRANLAALETLLGKQIVPGRCLLFFDEIQALPELFARLRYFHEELPELHVAAAGSLLDFALAEHTASMPVGRISYLHLGPLSFPEFVTALAGERTTQFLRTLRLGQTPPTPLHEKLMALLRDYSLVGGMPAVVEQFRTSRSFVAAAQAQHDLLATFRDDFARYGTRIPAARLQLVLDSVARQIGGKFMWTAVDREQRAQALRGALDALCRARVCRRVQCSHGNGVPLGADLIEKEFKVAMVDTGLVQGALGLLLRASALPGELVHEGPLAEHLVGQMLADLPPRFVEPTLWYWARHRDGSEAEVDYLLQHGAEVVPVEVKAGKTGTLRSLHRFVVEKKAKLAVRISAAGPQIATVIASVPDHPPRDFQLLSIPFYLVPELPRLLDEALATPLAKATGARAAESVNRARPRRREG
ncbi:MAG: AAA family ATPase [Planctomycetota bacterium]